MTHALLTRGVINSTAGTKVQIGEDIILPADGPWIVHHIHGSLQKADGTGKTATPGFFQIDSVEGAMNPDPAPGQFPFVYQSAENSAGGAANPVPLVLIPVQWEVAGKGTLRLNAEMATSAGTTLTAIAGIMFGRERPIEQPIIFSAMVTGRATETGETFIGTIQLSERATEITHLYPDFALEGPPVNDFPNTVSIRLDSDDVDLTPAQFPCVRQYAPRVDAQSGSPAIPELKYYPVKIPVEKGARINVFATIYEGSPEDINVTLFIGYK